MALAALLRCRNARDAAVKARAAEFRWFDRSVLLISLALSELASPPRTKKSPVGEFSPPGFSDSKVFLSSAVFKSVWFPGAKLLVRFRPSHSAAEIPPRFCSSRILE